MPQISRFVLAVALVTSCSSVPSASPRVGFSGYHGVRMGMTPAEATTAYREPLAPNSPLQDERDCYHLFPGGRVGPVAFMVYEGLVVRVEVTGPGVLTEDGVGVGSLESEVEEAYSSKAVVSPHKYTGPKGHYLTVAGDESLQLVFETDGTRVTEFRAGKLPEVGWVEGCQ